MTTPTPAALRAASDLKWIHDVGAMPTLLGDEFVPWFSRFIDHKTGLPELLAMLRSARQFAANAIAANVDLPDFNPAEHELVRRIDAVLARHERTDQ